MKQTKPTKREKKEEVYSIKKIAEFPLIYRENYERVTLALALSGYFVRVTNGGDGQNKVVEVYTITINQPK